jgi:hypothetical protein
MISDELARLIREGYNALGELEFTESPSGYRLYHWADRDSLSLAQVYRSAEDARQIAKYDAAGAYRALKGAPRYSKTDRRPGAKPCERILPLRRPMPTDYPVGN